MSDVLLVLQPLFKVTSKVGKKAREIEKTYWFLLQLKKVKRKEENYQIKNESTINHEK